MRNNGAVILTRELRVRIDGPHRTSLEALAKMHGWDSPTALAESLLARGIEEAARNTAQKKFLDLVIGQFQCSVVR